MTREFTMNLNEQQILVIVDGSRLEKPFYFWDGGSGWETELRKSFRTKNPVTAQTELEKLESLGLSGRMALLTLSTTQVKDGPEKGKWKVQYQAEIDVSSV
jgi:hypothetical protein